MANFKYKARDKFGKLAVSTISADNKDEAAKKLKEMGYIPVFLSQVRELRADEILKKFKRIKHEDLNTFTRQLFSLQKAGVPLLGSLDSIASQTRDKYFKLVIEEVAADIKAGMSFSESLTKQPQVFDGIYISMIKAAETGGALSEILDRLATLIEQEIDTNQRIKSATRYPLIAFFALIVGFVIVVAFVIPRFATLYSQFDALLPLPTRILIGVNVAFQKYWLICLLVAVGGGFGFSRFIKSKFGRPLWDNLKLKTPVLGKLLSMLIMSRFARVTAILMRSGTPILEVLNLVAKTSGNIIISRAIGNIRESVNEGKGMSEPMRFTSLFPPVVVQMVAIGEQTGKVDELLLGVADYYDREAGYLIRNLTTYIEPILILVLAGMVLIMALGIFMPMWNLIKVFNPG